MTLVNDATPIVQIMDTTTSTDRAMIVKGRIQMLRTDDDDAELYWPDELLTLNMATGVFYTKGYIDRLGLTPATSLPTVTRIDDLL